MLPMTLTGLIFVWTVLLLGQMFWLGRQTVAGGKVPETEAAAREFLVWRSFYVNPQDPRGWLPKFSGYGHTVNFRSMGQVYLFVALILADLLTAAALTFAVV